jgi:hypothetical protein
MKANYDHHVFLNCPFDGNYTHLLHALIFVVHDCGFVARSALEVMEVGETRLKKILRIIEECQFGIHDLSRVELSEGKHPRFNMPFECGLFWGAMAFGDKKQKGKRLLVLDKKRFNTQRTMSDIAGQDVEPHNNQVSKLINAVRNFLKTNSTIALPGSNVIQKRFRKFQRELPLIAKALGISDKEILRLDYFSDYRDLVSSWLSVNAR